jgi:hypothetical protein
MALPWKVIPFFISCAIRRTNIFQVKRYIFIEFAVCGCANAYPIPLAEDIPRRLRHVISEAVLLEVEAASKVEDMYFYRIKKSIKRLNYNCHYLARIRFVLFVLYVRL